LDNVCGFRATIGKVVFSRHAELVSVSGLRS
jgi:hypothetical protein